MSDKKKTGRPKKDIDWEKVDVLSRIHAPANEIHEYLNALGFEGSYDTYDRRCKEEFGCTFAEYVNKRHLALAKPRLRELQWAAAETGNVTMLIWLGKQHLGQKEPERVIDKEDPTDWETIGKAAAKVLGEVDGLKAAS